MGSPDDPRPGAWTRRRFLEAVGRAGGAAAVYETMTAMGLLHVPPLFAGPVDIPNDFGKGTSVVILGAGIAGLTAAYELSRKGYTVTVLEMTGRAGGRNRTVRRGDQIIEFEGEKNQTVQTCEFDEGLYLNVGPGRIPYHHTAVLHYCRILGVPLEPYIMMTRANLYATGDWRNTNRQIINDTNTHIAELLSKAINCKALDEDLKDVDKKELLSLLQKFGDLQKPGFDSPSRAGVVFPPEEPEFKRYVTSDGHRPKLLTLPELLTSSFWKHRVYQPEDYLWQPTLFQPVGGMDGIVKGFLPHVMNLIEFDRKVTSIRNSEKGVEVTSVNVRTGYECAPINADWCISTIPFEILDSKVQKDGFSQAYLDGIHAVKGAPTCKVGWQANRRFWEEDDQIYGGISFIADNITQMWYPSSGFFGQKGTLTGAYNFGDDAIEMGEWDLNKRRDVAYAQAMKLHPKFGQDVPKNLGLSIAWRNITSQRGGWADWTDKNLPHYQTFLAPDKRFWISGDQVSFLPGWQEGAMRSANYAIQCMVDPSQCISMRLKTTAPTGPRSADVVG